MLARAAAAPRWTWTAWLPSLVARPIWLTVGLAALLRLLTITRQGLWFDEAATYWAARLPLAEIPGWTAENDPHPPLYYLVIYPFVLLGGSEFLLRLPSLVAGSTSVALIYLLAEELFDRRTAILAALLLAVAPLHIWYSQEARMYALVVCFMLAAALFAARALRTNRPLDWVLLAVFEALALWTNYSAIWFALALNAWALLILSRLWRGRQIPAWIASQALAFLLYLPWLPSFLRQSAGSEAGWIPPATLTILGRTLGDFAAGFNEPRPLVAVGLLAVAATFAFGARAAPEDARQRWTGYALALSWFVVPLGLCFLISQPYLRVPLPFLGGHDSVFLTRTLLLCVVPLCLALARLVTLAPFAGRVALAGLILVAGLAYANDARPDRKAEYRKAVDIIASRLQPQDVIVLSPVHLESPLGYYVERRLGLRIDRPTLRDGVVTLDDQQQLFNQSIDALAGHRRVWLVVGTGSILNDKEGVAKAVESRGQVSQRWTLRDVRLELVRLR